MSEYITVKSRFLLGTVFAALAGISGLASCGSGSLETPSRAAPTLAPLITVAPSVITHFVNDAGLGNVTVTSVNYLTNGAYIVISGTTSYDGTYAVANVDTVNHGSFTIPHAFVADETGTWKPAGGMISGCTNQGAPSALSAINLSTDPSRFHGVAPFSVFFDTTATTASSTTRPFHDLEYRWNFGETTGPGVANWTYGSTKGSRNTATGPVAAHVFESPGLYTVVLSATDGTNTVTNNCAQIAVESPDSFFDGVKTVCVSTSGSFADCPSADPASHVTTSNFVTAMGNISSTVKRILFRAGETTNWTASATSNIKQAGPGIIGAYGTGAKPFVQVSGDAIAAIEFTVGNDWRVMDIAFDAIGTSFSSAIQIQDRKQITIIRVDVTNTDNAFGTADTSLPNSDQLTIQDSTSNGVNNGQGHVNVWVLGERFAFQGNHIDNTRPATGVAGGEHVLRFPKVTKGVISNNDVWNPQNFNLTTGKHCLDLHAAYRGSAWDGTYTEQVVIADNIFQGNAATPWDVHIGSQAGGFDERLRNIIVERNYFSAAAGNNVAVNIFNTVGTTVRNNIMNMGTSSTGMGVSRNTGELGPRSDLTYIYNNTFYSSYVPNNNHVVTIAIAPEVLTTTVRNNLVLTPNDNSYWGVVGTGTTLVSDHNLLSTAVADIIVNATPTVPADFKLKALPNPARDAGTTVPVWSDFYGPNPPNGTTRAQNIIFDIGADEVP